MRGAGDDAADEPALSHVARRVGDVRLADLVQNVGKAPTLAHSRAQMPELQPLVPITLAPQGGRRQTGTWGRAGRWAIVRSKVGRAADPAARPDKKFTLDIPAALRPHVAEADGSRKVYSAGYVSGTASPSRDNHVDSGVSITTRLKSGTEKPMRTVTEPPRNSSACRGSRPSPNTPNNLLRLLVTQLDP